MSIYSAALESAGEACAATSEKPTTAVVLAAIISIFLIESRDRVGSYRGSPECWWMRGRAVGSIVGG